MVLLARLELADDRHRQGLSRNLLLESVEIGGHCAVSAA